MIRWSAALGVLAIAVSLPGLAASAPAGADPYQSTGERQAERKPTGFALALPWGSTTEEVSHTVASGYSPSGGSSLHDHTGRDGVINDYYALDFDMSSGDEVRAVAAGTVVWAGSYGTTSSWTCFGNSVSIAHEGAGAGYTSFYAHLSALQIASGTHVRQGEVIGKAGNSGSDRTWTDKDGNTGQCIKGMASHLHFGLYHNAPTPKDSPPYGGTAVLPEPFQGATDYSDLQKGQSLKASRLEVGSGGALPLSAQPTAPFFYDVVVAGETAHLKIEIRNDGTTAWDPAQGIELRQVRQNDVVEKYALPRAVSPSQVVSWDVTTQPGGTQWSDLRFRMYRGSTPFGPEIAGVVIALPEQLKEQKERIRQALEQQVREWQQQAGQELDRQIQNLQRQIAEQVKRELERQVSSCGGAALILLPLGAIVVRRRWFQE